MRLKKHIIVIIIACLSIALIGLVTIQILILGQAVRMTNQTFSSNVNGALASVVEKLETQEKLNRALGMTLNTSGKDTLYLKKVVKTEGDTSTKQTQMLLLKTRKDNHRVKLDKDQLMFRLDKSQRVRLSGLNEQREETLVYIDEIRNAGPQVIQLDKLNIAKNQILKLSLDNTDYYISLRKPHGSIIPGHVTDNFDRRLLMDKVLEQAFRFNPSPIEDRIDVLGLDSMVMTTLLEFGLPSECAYGILSAENDSVILAKPVNLNKQLILSPFRTRLFPHDVFDSTSDLVFHFPNQRWLLLRSAGPLAIITLIFIMVIIACFIIVLRMLFAQRHLSEMLRDFINNMTHEFKTPLSTISLASEAMTSSDVIKDKKRLKKFGKIIGDESARMHKQVEKILEMAALEKEDVELNRTHVDIHSLIRDVVAKFSVRIQHGKGTIELNLKTSNFMVHGDALHLENMLYNLLDNAVKYTKENPEIHILSENEKNGIRISVRDNGLGLTPDQQKHIFDKYYRVSTGNVHDVKGFGLGLSYVKLMVEAHGGIVRVSSTQGKGSVFEIFLPTVKNFEPPDREAVHSSKTKDSR